MIDDKRYLGQKLLERGFRQWFLYLFRAINGTEWKELPIHKKMFAQIRDIIDANSIRVCMNLCPRSGKTTLATWLVVYALTINPKSQIIYTSFNQDLLNQIAQQVAAIMTHPIYQALFGSGVSIEQEETDPIDDFWRDYLVETTGKIKFSNRKIYTPQGGIVLFNSIGSAITGFGVSIKNYKGFSGILILDDPDKPTDIRSEKIRNKTHTYFEETLLSRLNNSDSPVLIIQQRLHIDDMTGFLTEQYGYKIFKAPLLNENGECNLGNQYTPERIKELQVNNYVFQSQYQQEPVILGGGVFKHEWWRYYKDINDTQYKRIFITADTANKTKEWNDYTAIGVWGLTVNNRLRLLDLIHAKMEMPELQQTFLTLWDKWKMGIGRTRCTAIYIEDKASGTQVIQTLKRQGGLPIMAYMPDKDKLSRALDCVPQVAAGNIELPENEHNQLSREFLIDLDAFSADGSALHDDITDCFTYACNTAYSQRGYF